MAWANRACPLPIEILCFFMASSKAFNFIQHLVSICPYLPQKVQISSVLVFFFSCFLFVFEEDSSFLETGREDLVFCLGWRETHGLAQNFSLVETELFAYLWSYEPPKLDLKG